MDRRRVEAVLADLKAGKVTVAEAMDRLRGLPYEDLGFARLDAHRDLRRGFPEVVYCPGKTPARIVEIVRSMSNGHALVLATRATPSIHARLRKALKGKEVAFHAEARLISVGRPPKAKKAGSPRSSRKQKRR